MNVDELIPQERERLTKAREDALSRKAEIDEEIAGIDLRLKALTAYEQVMNGKQPAGKRRNARTGMRSAILETLKQHPDGIIKGDLVTNMNADDPDQKRAISSALSALKRDGKAQNVDGKWTAT